MSLQATGLTVTYRNRTGTVRALDAVDLELLPGDGLGVIGASGSGKSTLLHVLIGLLSADQGAVLLDGRDAREDPRAFRRAVQFVPQDPAASLDPLRTVGSQVGMPLRRLGVPGDHRQMISRALERVGLDPAMAGARVTRLSGGEAQRVALARAVVTGPRCLLADEPTSGLDAPLRLQVLDLLAELRGQGMGVLLVSHDLSGVHRLCDRLVVVAAGRVVEHGDVHTVMHTPLHATTRMLIDAAPRIEC